MELSLRILELCPFSAGICGVWARVLQESQEFTNLGHKVMVFSSEVEKGTLKVCAAEENLGGIRIRRFSSNGSSISKNVRYWFGKDGATLREINQYNPDIIITHLLHPHSAKLSKLIEDLKQRNPKLKILIVPHAPFNIKRRFPLNLATPIWRKLSALDLRKFDKIIAITNWEVPYLLKLGVGKEKIVYIPNGIPSEFFQQKKSPSTKDVLFLGRISPVKSLEIFLAAAKLLPQVSFSIVGAPEPDYLKKLEKIIRTDRLTNVKIYPPVYSIKDKIQLIDSHRIFILPSKRDAMPQVLLEAMARARVVLASRTDGSQEIIQDNKTGLLFNIGDYKQLAHLIKKNLRGNKKIQSNAELEARKYSWKKLIKSYESVFQQ